MSVSLTEVVESLNEKTPDEIAQVVPVGERYQSCRCPVAKFISNKLNHDPFGLAVGSDRIEVWTTKEGFIDVKQEVMLDTYENVRDFIIRFDNGHYPGLEIE